MPYFFLFQFKHNNGIPYTINTTSFCSIDISHLNNSPGPFFPPKTFGINKDMNY